MSNLKLPPIDIVTINLEVKTLNLVPAIDIEHDAIREEPSLTETAVSKGTLEARTLGMRVHD